MSTISTNDHSTVGACQNFKVNKEPAYMQLVQQYMDANFQEFRDAVLNTNFEECFSINDIDEVCAKWTTMFLDTSTLHVPNKQVIVRQNDSLW